MADDVATAETKPAEKTPEQLRAERAEQDAAQAEAARLAAAEAADQARVEAEAQAKREAEEAAAKEEADRQIEREKAVAEQAEADRQAAEAQAEQDAKATAVIADPPREVPAAERVRAFEDEHLGKDAVRIGGRIERGSGSPFAAMSDEKKRQYAALEKLVAAEQKLADAHTALIQAETDHEAALAAAEPKPDAGE